MTDTEKYRSQIYALIDRGSWQHSWHLEKDTNGYILWSNSKNHKRIYELITEAKGEAKDLERKIEEAETALEILQATGSS